MNSINARTKGLMPDCLNFLKFVSAPNAVIAMVSAKLSALFIPSTTASGSRFNELKPITIKKPKANQGMVILDFSAVSIPCLRFFLPTSMLRIRRKGASSITLIIFTITELSAITGLLRALPAPTTCATSCTVDPMYIPI